jgi:hypothetical protein
MNDDDKDKKGQQPSIGATEYKVGNKKPPKHSQFKAGSSGNPTGRPKGAQNFNMLVMAELSSLTKIHEAGKTKKVTKLQAMAKILVNKAMNGDPKAYDKLQPIWAADEAEKKKIQQERKPICWTEEQEKLYQEIQAVAKERDANLDTRPTASDGTPK